MRTCAGNCSSKSRDGHEAVYRFTAAATEAAPAALMDSPVSTNSTRRFCCRPAEFSLDATGADSPSPFDEIEPDLLVVAFVTNAIGVAFDLQREVGMSQDDPRHLRELLARSRTKCG